MIQSLVMSLFLTLVIELSIALIIGIKERNDIKVVICANVCTNPVVVFIVNLVYYFDALKYLGIVTAVLEISAFITEALIYKKYLKYDKITPFAISFLCNLISYGTGVILDFMKI